MSTVRLLPPEIISKIAAGEVIERPASVVKELIENALDAGTGMIDLEVKEAGKALIRLRDTGNGIARDDLSRIFQRHATSKIATLDDLFNIHSLGFRGEALYSIAAISDVILRSRTQKQEEGWETHWRGSQQIGLKPVSMPQGTEIEVQELFFNTPARRKFMKSNTTEMNQILSVFLPYGLAHPHTHFRLTHQGRKILDLKADKTHMERVCEALNTDEKNLIEAAQADIRPGLSFHVILGDINIVRSRRDLQFIFINGRPVQNKAVSFHLNDVYRLILPGGHYPLFIAMLTLPAEDLDVNIHPAKREVKIKDEQDVCSLLRRLCENALMTRGKAKQMTTAPEKPSPLAPIAKVLAAEPENFSGTGYLNISQRNEPPVPSPKTQKITEEYSYPQALFPKAAPIADSAPLRSYPGSLTDQLAGARYIGTFQNKFLLFETPRSLLLLDQHAAQERITYERYIRQIQKGQVEVQHLLSPYLLKLTPSEILIFEESKDILEQFGFACTLFDEDTLAVQSYPVLIPQPEMAVRELLAGEHPARCNHESIARRACRSSVMAGDKLSAQQAEYQKEELLQCLDPFTCPHGRPIVIEMSEEFLNKQFLRT